MRADFESIDAYIASFSEPVQALLQAMRQAIRESAPDASEKISYAIPTFALHGNLVHFAAFEQHIGFYPGASGIAHFATDLKAYKSAKGSVQFPLAQPLPLDLVRRIVAFRAEENLIKASTASPAKAHKQKKH